MAMLMRVCCGAVALVMALTVGLVRNYDKYIRPKLYLLVPEPEGIREALQRSTVPTLSEKDLQTLKDDGVLLIRDLVQGNDTLHEMRRRMSLHSHMPFLPNSLGQKSWLYNGAVRALLRYGPFGDLVTQVTGKSVYIRAEEAPIWAYGATRTVKFNDWHVDERRNQAEMEMLSIWMVLTTGSTALQFIRGSHLWRAKIEDACAKPLPGGKKGFKVYNRSCTSEYTSWLEKEFNMTEPALYGPPLKAGDAFLFNGNILHRGVQQPCDRLAISFRIRWRSHRIEPDCSYFSPQVYPPGPKQEWDFACAPWALLPGLPRITPWLLPGDFSSAMRRLLERG